MEERVQCNQLAASGCLASQRVNLYSGLSIGLCSWQVRHSTVTVARSPLVGKGSFFEYMHGLHLCHHDYSFNVSIVSIMG